MTTENIDELRGKILCGAVGLESHLDFFIANYFIRPQNQKTFFFKDSILHKMSFEDKIKIFTEICRREDYDKTEVAEIRKHIKYIQELRNKVAHWEAVSGSGETVQLRDCKSKTCEKDNICLDTETMALFEQEMSKAMDGITKFYLKYSREGTIDERTVSQQTR